MQASHSLRCVDGWEEPDPWGWSVDIPGLERADAARLYANPGSAGLPDWLSFDSSRTSVRWVANAGGVAFEVRVLHAAVSGRGRLPRALRQLRADLIQVAEDWWGQRDASAPDAGVTVKLITDGYWLMGVDSEEEARLMARWAQGAGYRPRLLDPALWRVTSEDRWLARRRRALLRRALGSGSLSAEDAAQARVVHRELGRWLARTWWPAVESVVSFRLGGLFPRWANRVIARDDGVSTRERPGQDEAADWPAAAWSVVIEGLRQEDAARIEAVMQDWPEPHRGSGGNPQERQVCFSDVTRVAVEVRLWEAVQRREIGPLLWNYTSRFRRRQRGWLASLAAGQPSDGVGRRLEAPEDAVLVYDADWEAWPEGHEGLSAERAQALVELAQGWGYTADSWSLHEWMPRSAVRDDVKMRRRITGVALRGGGLSGEEREVARRIRLEEGAWLRRTRSVAVRHRLFSGWKWVLREIDWWTCGLPAGSRGKEPRGAYQRSS